jgi:hypothetical protein
MKVMMAKRSLHIGVVPSSPLSLVNRSCGRNTFVEPE